MRRIIKRLFKRDALGNVHQETVQELVDDEQGTISETEACTYGVCQTCARPIQDPNDIRACDRCGRLSCGRCAVPCAVCSRALCAHCRRGFPEKQLVSCPECLFVLNERMGRQDRLLQEKIAFERRLAVQREQLRLMQYGMLHPYHRDGLLQNLAELMMIRKLNRLERGADHEGEA